MITQPRPSLPALGLVCISASDRVRFKALTRKRLLSLEPEQQAQTLRTLYAENTRRLAGAIDFCQEQNIRLYRLSSALFPFADDPLGAAVLPEFASELRIIGDRATALGIRLVLHPDQFVVLSSDRPDVIENSIKILAAHAWIFDLLGLPQSSWALMNIHGGKSDRAERLIQTIRSLPENIRSRLTLENDEHAYSSAEILAVCQAAGVPFVFDAHHHIIHERLDSYDHPSVTEMLEAARSTWPVPEWQLVHISNGQMSFQDPKHSDFIYDMPASYRNVAWIEIEAKLKEEAIARLQQDWLPTLVQPSYEPAIVQRVEQAI